MSNKFIPEYIDPLRFAEQDLGLSGIVALEEMTRLKDYLHSSTGTVKVDLQFGIDEQKIAYLTGHLETNLNLLCQRCLEPFIIAIRSDFKLGIVNSLEEANDLPEHYEPVLTQDTQLGLRNLIEDELILNLPIIPKHETKDCKISLAHLNAGQEKIETPFHVLKKLKDK